MAGESAILQHLEAGGTVVTATRRQARLLRRRHEAAQRRAGRRVWRSADVLPLEAWLERCWLEAADAGAPHLLGVAEANWRWRRQVRSHVEGTLIEERDLAGAARAAWVSLLAHGGRTGDLVGTALTREQQAFLEWATAVEADLAAHGWLDPALLPAALADRAGRFAARARLLFVGFLRPTPQLRSLAEAVARGGGQASFHEAGAQAGRCARLAAEHPQDELEAILDWLATVLAQHPEACVGVVVPDLAARRGALQRAFDSALQPSLELPGGLERDRRVDFAGGPPLSGYRVAGDALACLSPGPLTAGEASRLLRSPYLGDPAEGEARLRFDLGLRAKGVYAWDADRLLREARAAGCPSIAAGLGARAELVREPARRLPSEWASVFGSVLKAWGWPARRPLASDEFQAAERFREVLSSLAALDRVTPALTASEARLELAQSCGAPFQPERGDAQVLLYDAFEAPGVALDGLWVGGVTASAWPRSPAPDPFLPAAIQRRLGMPGATAEAAREEALAVTGAWMRTAAEVVFSWPLRQDDAEAEPSRLLPAGLPAHDRRARAPSRERRMLQQAEREPLAGDEAPPLDPGRARGGARMLELQSKCPFRAFAELRLGARPLEEPGPGVDRRVRGTVLHAALERAWRELGGSAGLAALDAAGRQDLVRRCVAAAMASTIPEEARSAAAGLEAEWQAAALHAALEADAARGEFEVDALERPVEAVLAGLPLRLRIDRVDRTPAGLVVIDYKTGEARISQWRSARPDAPQLPLYAALSGREVAAVAFASVRASGASYRGVGEQAAGLPGLTAAERFRVADAEEAGLSWAELRARWSAWLARLAEQHRAGVAEVDPKQPQTCRLCHLGTLCRVDRHAAGEEDEEGTDG